MAYNPNSIWGSKEKKEASPSENATPAKEPAPVSAPASFVAPTPTPVKLTEPAAASEPSSPSFFRRHGLIFFTIGIFLLIGLVAYIYYLLLPPSAPNVVVAFSDPGTVTVGQPFPLTVTVSNESKSVLQNADLNISLPAGIVLVGNDPSHPQAVVTESLGTLSSQTVNPPQTVTLVAIANPGTAQTIGAQVTYGTASTGATQFQSVASTSVTIGTQSALSLSYNAPSDVFSGQDFDIVVDYVNNTTGTLDGVQFAMQYPPAYHFVMSSTTAPTGAADNIWNLGTLAPGATGMLDINGNIVGPAQAQYPLTGTIGATFSGHNYPASVAPVNFVVTPSPLSLSLSLDNSQTYVAGLSDSLNYTLTYTNNSKVTFQSVNISAGLVGSMYNFSSLKTSGSFNSQSDTITWYAANTPALASLAPGQSGTLSFTITTKPTFPIDLPSDKNYSLSVTAKATSPTVPPNTAGTNTTSITALTDKVGGKISLVSDGFYKEASTTIVNTGPYPPVVNQPTTYTIHWSIVNYSTDMQNVTVSAYLQSGSTFTGMATSTGLTSTTLPVYNAGTGEVTWTIPYIPATAGVISPPVQTVFQVTNTPAVNQVSQAVTLLGPATLTASDVYTSSTVQATAPAVTTNLLDDPYAAGQAGQVTQQ
ncbi:MAG TPA: hypothetical protein VIJ29_01280 [Candidatus Paceibacterota bacterium]